MGRHGSGVLASTFLTAGCPESDPQSHPIQSRSRRLIWIAPGPRIITATFAMCGSVACNGTKSGSSSGSKKKNVTPEQEQRVWGDSSTGTAIDADTKFCVTHYSSDRSGTAAHEFMQDCAERIVGRPRITRTRIGQHLYLLGRNNFLQRRHRHHESAECFDINALGKGNRPLPCTLAQKQILVVYTEQLTHLTRRAA